MSAFSFNIFRDDPAVADFLETKLFEDLLGMQKGDALAQVVVPTADALVAGQVTPRQVIDSALSNLVPIISLVHGLFTRANATAAAPQPETPAE